MNQINYVIGDVTHPNGDGIKFIAHCCNNLGAWGRGVVLAISRRWGMPELMYRKFAEEHPNELRESLGEIQTIPVEKDIIVINIIGQDGIGTKNGVPPIRYEAIREGLIKIQETMENYKNPSLHLPRMGAGLAGGKWEEIEKIILETIEFPVTVYTLKKEAHLYGMS
jgi:O-acetyl-ADP-ribose deacetylase (regulator of RNase III)